MDTKCIYVELSRVESLCGMAHIDKRPFQSICLKNFTKKSSILTTDLGTKYIIIKLEYEKSRFIASICILTTIEAVSKLIFIVQVDIKIESKTKHN